ncbi:uncharacterized protein LOC135943628 isoform X1 [Cloeon dipterum]|uniref:uncharacterized protein LOC135943628 isoform X1 n=1 Tax=Cloeon dipterum TaxID=197152 RepID=UPI00321FD582
MPDIDFLTPCSQMFSFGLTSFPTLPKSTPHVDLFDKAWQLRLAAPGGVRRQVLLVPAVAGDRVLDLAAVLGREPVLRRRRECLAHGGGLQPRQLVAAALAGKQVSPQELASALVRDLETRHSLVDRAVNA